MQGSGHAHGDCRLRQKLWHFYGFGKKIQGYGAKDSFFETLSVSLHNWPFFSKIKNKLTYIFLLILSQNGNVVKECMYTLTNMHTDTHKHSQDTIWAFKIFILLYIKLIVLYQLSHCQQHSHMNLNVCKEISRGWKVVQFWINSCVSEYESYWTRLVMLHFPLVTGDLCLPIAVQKGYSARREVNVNVKCSVKWVSKHVVPFWLGFAMFIIDVF